jgi:hypothetical protein
MRRFVWACEALLEAIPPFLGGSEMFIDRFAEELGGATASLREHS